jgi:hypothetical protein
MKSVMLIVFVLINLSLFSQTNSVNPFPQAPSVSNFNQFVDIPVDLANGIPDINIPIYTIETNGLELPISLNYHADGIKVTERADWVGLKWYLNTGGEINRDFKHVPDEATHGFLMTGNSLNFNGGTSNQANMQDIMGGNIDSEADIFTFSIPGYSGKFYFDVSGNVVQIPKSDLKITYNAINYNENTESRLKSFVITNPEGIKYYFGQSKDGAITAIDKQELQGVPSLGNIDLPISWKLLEIENPSIKDNITFTYEIITNLTDFYLTGWQKYYFQVFNGRDLQYNSYTNELLRNDYTLIIPIKNKLKSIQTVSNYTKVEFISNNIRLDSNCPKAKSLDEIIIYCNETAIKKLKLNYDYYTAINNNDYFNKRLRLISVQEVNPLNSNDMIPPYSIVYNSIILPKFHSRATDHWGFYNGQESNSFENIPLDTIIVNWDPNPKIIGGSNRETVENYLKQGIIEKIVLPTGGQISFEFEANDYFNSNSQLNVKVGGLRIKKISQFINNTIQNYKEYDFCIPETTQSSGLLLITPNHYFSSTYQVMHFPSSPGTLCGILSDGSSVNMQLVSENAIHDSYTFDGKLLTYGYCKIKYSNGSCEIINFQNSTSPYPDYNYPPKPIFRDLHSNLEVNNKTKNEIGIELKNINKEYIKRTFSEPKTMGKLWGIDLYFQYSLDCGGYGRGTLWALNTFNYQTGFNLLQTENITDNNINVIKTNIYDDPNFINYNIKSKTVNWNGIVKKTDYKYAQDLGITFMTNANMIGLILKTENFLGAEKLDEVLTQYAYDNSTSNLIEPKYQYAKKGTDVNAVLEKKITFDLYDDKGNLKQYTTELGQPVSIVWGYNKTQPIAKVKGLAYSSLPTTKLNAAISASDLTGSNYVEATLLSNLDELRDDSALDNSFITTYTYKPLIGISTVKDPKGDRLTYTYDFFNRLELVKDLNGKIINQYEYHYKN